MKKRNDSTNESAAKSNGLKEKKLTQCHLSEIISLSWKRYPLAICGGSQSDKCRLGIGLKLEWNEKSRKCRNGEKMSWLEKIILSRSWRNESSPKLKTCPSAGWPQPSKMKAIGESYQKKESEEGNGRKLNGWKIMYRNESDNNVQAGETSGGRECGVWKCWLMSAEKRNACEKSIGWRLTVSVGGYLAAIVKICLNEVSIQSLKTAASYNARRSLKAIENSCLPVNGLATESAKVSMWRETHMLAKKICENQKLKWK